MQRGAARGRAADPGTTRPTSSLRPSTTHAWPTWPSQCTSALAALAEHEPWGFKDPRTCLTAAYWLDLQPDLRFIVCVRHPLEVALSLKRRNQNSYSLGLALWERYYRSVLDLVPADRRIVTHYDTFFVDAPSARSSGSARSRGSTPLPRACGRTSATTPSGSASSTPAPAPGCAPSTRSCAGRPGAAVPIEPPVRRGPGPPPHPRRRRGPAARRAAPGRRSTGSRSARRSCAPSTWPRRTPCGPSAAPRRAAGRAHEQLASSCGRERASNGPSSRPSTGTGCATSRRSC